MGSCVCCCLKADWACVLVNTNKHPSLHRNKSLVCVKLSEPGIHRSKPIKKLGMHCSDTSEIFFDDVRVPVTNIIGEEGRGFMYQMMQFQDERLVAVATVHFTLAELQTELEAVRAILYRAVLSRITGKDVTLLASMAKLKAGRLARVTTDSCLQFWGGNGFTWDNPISRLHRDLRLHSLAAGADQVMLSIICKHMGTLPK
uniref:Acyl-CoA_dh_1 domain-containing protein n=1 Tax=Heterorhabditis bacteriophora TaxID=37862 RepID=A0A1I7WUQ4_HETBA